MESKEEEFHEPQALENEPRFPKERLYVKDGDTGDLNQGVKTRSSYKNICEYVAFLSNLMLLFFFLCFCLPKPHLV